MLPRSLELFDAQVVEDGGVPGAHEHKPINPARMEHREEGRCRSSPVVADHVGRRQAEVIEHGNHVGGSVVQSIGLPGLGFS